MSKNKASSEASSSAKKEKAEIVRKRKRVAEEEEEEEEETEVERVAEDPQAAQLEQIIQVICKSAPQMAAILIKNVRRSKATQKPKDKNMPPQPRKPIQQFKADLKAEIKAKKPDARVAEITAEVNRTFEALFVEKKEEYERKYEAAKALRAEYVAKKAAERKAKKPKRAPKKEKESSQQKDAEEEEAQEEEEQASEAEEDPETS